MLAKSPENSQLTLFELYRKRFDPENRLQALAPDADANALWDKIEQELGVPSQVLCAQIGELCDLPCHLSDVEIPLPLVKSIPYKTLRQFQIAPVSQEDKDLMIATANPKDSGLVDVLGFMFGSHYKLTVAHPRAIASALEMLQESATDAGEDKKSLNLSEVTEDTTESRATPRLARQLMIRALRQRASDLHVQPFLKGAVARIRVDGLLQRVTLLPDRVAEAIIRYFKAHSGMDPTLNTVPQDGRMVVELDGREYDLRISTLPVTEHGEKLVIRFLNRLSVFKLTEIGFSLDELHAVQRLAKRPSGVVLVCGPTGSGKTTTLYSILQRLNKEDVSIMTVENPVEYQVPGLSQTEVNDKAGMTFPRALRAILRQDPDVLLIGEIRDEETAQIAMQSALTGHLVFTTLHTNDSLSAIPRLLDLDINPVILAESLAGIMSQRLLRKLCEHCKEDFHGEGDPAATAFAQVSGVQQGSVAKGCKHCNFSGYKGRTVVAEIVDINHAQRELLLGGESDIAKFKSAMRGTFSSMAMSASRLIISGLTSASEASRVLGQQFWLALAEEYGRAMPDLSALSEASDNKESRAVLLVSETPGNDSETALREGLEDSWLEVHEAGSPEEADSALREHEQICLVVVDLAPQLSDDEVVEKIAAYRRRIAWARIPALLRFPESKPHWPSLLRAHGATSKFVSLSTAAEEVVVIIQQAITDHVDFKWGLQTKPEDSE